MFKIACVFILGFQMLQINSCSKEEVSDKIDSKLVGTWVLKNVFLGDAIDTPCGYATKGVRELTMVISEDTESKTLKISGQSAINVYNGSLSIISSDTSNGISTIKIGALGSSKMAGPPDLMECETRLYNFLNEAPELRISDTGELNIGRFKKDNTPSRDGGTFLIYEKKK